MPGIKTITRLVPTLLALAGTYAAPFQRRGMDQVISQCNHNFAYTFDDGPYDWNTDLVKKFDTVGAKTTFFVNGNNWRCIYSEANVQALRYAYERGHQFASHTWSHADLVQLTETQIDAEILRLDEAFVKILGVKPKLFRPPYGSIDERTASYIQSKHGKTIVLWDLDSGDTAPGANEQGSIDFYTDLAAEGPNSKHITLSHEVWRYAVDAAVNHTVDVLHDAGVNLLTVAQCLDTDAYEVVAEYGVRDETWTCEGTWTPPSTPSPSTPGPSTPGPSTSGPSTPGPSTPGPSTSGPSTPGPSTPVPSTSGPSTPGPSTPGPSTTVPPASVPTDPVPSSSSSAPPTTTTTACKETYTSTAGDNCTKIEAKYNLVTGTLKAANPFVTCNDIWAWTPLCIPDGPYNASTTSSSTSPTTSAPACKQTYTSSPKDSCASIENQFNLVEGTIKAANPFLTCTDIWTGTPICVPDGPYKSTGPSEPSCVTQNYQSLAGETCSSIETKFALQAGSVAAANRWVNCLDIWTDTNLSVCVPTLSASDPQTCTKRMSAATVTTCAAVGAANGVSAAWIKAWNAWINCADIWQGTDLCVAH